MARANSFSLVDAWEINSHTEPFASPYQLQAHGGCSRSNEGQLVRQQSCDGEWGREVGLLETKVSGQLHKQYHLLQTVATARSNKFLFRVVQAAGHTSINGQCPQKPETALVILGFLWASKYAGISPYPKLGLGCLRHNLVSNTFSPVYPSELYLYLYYIIALCSVLLYSCIKVNSPCRHYYCGAGPGLTHFWELASTSFGAGGSERPGMSPDFPVLSTWLLDNVLLWALTTS